MSVVIPAFNAGPFLRRAVDSVRAQTCTDWEIVVVNDGSTDDTAAVAAALRAEIGERLTLLSPPRGGASAARNHGIAAARGAFIAFLDADDAFLPEKLARQMELFAAAPDVGLVFSDFSSIRLDGSIERSRFDDPSVLARTTPSEEIAPRLHVCGEGFFDVLLRQHFISPITAIVRREALGDRVRFPVGLEYWEERVFFLEVAHRTRAGYVNEPLSVNHYVRGSLSRTDAAKNHRHRVRAVEEIIRRFPAVSSAARRGLRAELLGCLRDLAFAQFRTGEYGPAASSFRRAFALQPRPRTALHWLQAALAERRGAPRASAEPAAADR